ncbi:MAG: hypothetical protein KHX11_23080 [Bacteroides cellulosilyticus]|jgi:hypothetical protein|uniref:NVEALA domain-containing protein n=2 Tax=Bacteroides cellulosilyticus TaxID=246787 RepID=A0A412ICG9_9BACE|nr:NVEALA domain-containing protein [Bacteroides cellulosilyticus]MBS5701909.1 hypothetical protein [Bacteroides cellulosilyticus]MDT4509843.1 NVEALA domain-containing protein [Bacteroides cellulosilyticus]MDV7049093.1 NVEALA domain-containing protein [Bacteroides cellulosilyticus]RGQ09047.1 hypothetical protein DWZ09_25185 [Bacteroides cellulosilyticus]RGS34554.1 hypothetical protein DWX97_19185 [Bacteroides cellulosilyticus]
MVGKKTIKFPPSSMQRFLPLLALNNIKCKGTMRNKMKFIGIAMILVVVALGYSKSRQPENLDTLLLDNVEALAAGEAADGGDCIGSGSIVCPFNNTEVAHVLVYYSLPH